MPEQCLRARAVFFVLLLAGHDCIRLATETAARADPGASSADPSASSAKERWKEENSVCSWSKSRLRCAGDGVSSHACAFRPLPLDKGLSTSCRLSSAHMVEDKSRIEEQVQLQSDVLKGRAEEFKAACIKNVTVTQIFQKPTLRCLRKAAHMFQASEFLSQALEVVSKPDEAAGPQNNKLLPTIKLRVEEAQEVLASTLGEDGKYYLDLVKKTKSNIAPVITDPLGTVKSILAKTQLLMSSNETKKALARKQINEMRDGDRLSENTEHLEADLARLKAQDAFVDKGRTWADLEAELPEADVVVEVGDAGDQSEVGDIDRDSDVQDPAAPPDPTPVPSDMILGSLLEVDDEMLSESQGFVFSLAKLVLILFVVLFWIGLILTVVLVETASGVIAPYAGTDPTPWRIAVALALGFHLIIRWMTTKKEQGFTGSVTVLDNPRLNEAPPEAAWTLTEEAIFRYLPLQFNGVDVVRLTTGNTYIVTNEELKAGTPGLNYRKSKDLADKDLTMLQDWNSTVEGEDAGDGWMKITIAAPSAAPVAFPSEAGSPRRPTRGRKVQEFSQLGLEAGLRVWSKLGGDAPGEPLIASMVPPPGVTYRFVNRHNGEWNLAAAKLDHDSDFQQVGQMVAMMQRETGLGGALSKVFGHKVTHVYDINGEEAFQIRMVKAVVNPMRLRWSFHIVPPDNSRSLIMVTKDVWGRGLFGRKQEWRIFHQPQQRGRRSGLRQMLYYGVGARKKYVTEFYKSKQDYDKSRNDKERTEKQVARVSLTGRRHFLRRGQTPMLEVQSGEDSALLIAVCAIMDITGKLRSDDYRLT